MQSFNTQLFITGRTYAAGLSGGKDSVCLLYNLLALQKKLGIKVVAINVEHGIRGEESVLDTEFCQSLCQKLNVPLKVYKVEAPKLAKKQKLTLEEAARKLRYQSFNEAIDSGFCDAVATAHHLGDNVETMLFNLFRGTSLSGLKGMDEICYGGKIIRPMLGVDKKEIDNFVNKHQIEYKVDSTNFDNDYSRNYIRNVILPTIEQKFPAYKKALARLSQSVKSDDDYLYSLAKEIVTFDKNTAVIKPTQDLPIFSRAVIIALKGLGVQKDFDNRLIGALFELSQNINGKMLNILGGLYAVKERGNLVIKHNIPVLYTEQKFALCDFDFNNYHITFDSLNSDEDFLKHINVENEGLKTLVFDSAKLPSDLVCRTRQVGDMFTKPNGQTVSLKKFLTDKKIPADEKDSLPLLCKDNTVYLIFGVEIGRQLMVEDKNKANLIEVVTQKID